jgi:hypothetical protein
MAELCLFYLALTAEKSSLTKGKYNFPEIIVREAIKRNLSEDALSILMRSVDVTMYNKCKLDYMNETNLIKANNNTLSYEKARDTHKLHVAYPSAKNTVSATLEHKEHEALSKAFDSLKDKSVFATRMR